MAEAYGKLTGTPGICFVTRGPGATNASIGVHTAFQDSTPMILFIGQVGSDFIEREAFQEIDYRRMFGPMAKWVAQIDRTDRIPEFIARAYQVATSGRMGPVVLALPEDMLFGERGSRGRAALAARRVGAVARRRWRSCARMLRAAQRPFLIVGGSGWNEAACADLRRFVETQRLAGRLRVPLPGSVRQRASELCRRRRHRHQSAARRAHQGGGPADRRSARGSARSRPAATG